MNSEQAKNRISLNALDISPTCAFNCIKKRFRQLDLFSPKYIFSTTIICCFLCYFYEMVYGLGCPDTLSEGVFFYRNADYSTSQARWMIRFLNEIFGKNIVAPYLIVMLYCMMIGVATYIICYSLKISRPYSQILITAMTISFPVVLHHFAYFYMATAYSFSFLMVVVGTFLVRKRKIYGFILGTLCYLLMMGSYQPYIGAISGLAIVLLVYDILFIDNTLKSLTNFLFTAMTGIISCIINFPISKLMMNLFNVSEDPRVGAFAVKDIFENIGFSLKYSYVWFFSYFNNDVLSRNRLYLVLFVIIGVLVVLSVIKTIKKKEFLRSVVLILSIAILPLAMNIMLIAIPSNGMRDIMRYQYVLLFPLIFVLHEYVGKNILNMLSEYAIILVISLLLVTNVISGISTAYMYKLSYDHYEQQLLMALDRVYQLDNYTENETTILTAGCPSIEFINYENSKIMRYAEKEGGPVFWYNVHGMKSSREHFFKDFLGVMPGYFSDNEYLEVVQSEEFAKMPVWPAKGSVEMINGIAVIKFADDPPM